MYTTFIINFIIYSSNNYEYIMENKNDKKEIDEHNITIKGVDV